MKKFTFPLGKVMDFRRMQARLEEIKLESLYAALRAIDSREAALIEQGVQAEKTMKSAASVTGRDLESFSAFRAAMKEQQKRMDKARAQYRKEIDAQLAVVTTKRREVKLLEKLKEQRFEKWEQEMFKLLDQQAEESFMSKWAASRE